MELSVLLAFKIGQEWLLHVDKRLDQVSLKDVVDSVWRAFGAR